MKNIANLKKTISNDNKYVKNPFNYIGGKYKLLPQILPYFPKNITNFIDLFGGGGEVSFNTNASKVFYNEKSTQLVNIFKNLDASFVKEVEETISHWGLSKENKNAFIELRKYYNQDLYNNLCREQAVVLYCLLTHAFNYQIAFNSKGQYNMPSGAGRSYFSPQLKSKLSEYIKRKDEISINFLNNDFLSINIDNLPSAKETFVYADPPYLITVGAYERDYFCKWSEQYEKQLLEYLDKLNLNNYKFALSNVLVHKGKENLLLKEWAKKYNIHYLDIDYKNCNYQTKDKSANSSIEVLITNY